MKFPHCLPLDNHTLVVLTLSASHQQKRVESPGWVAKFVRALSRYVKVAGAIPSQGTTRKQQMNA